MDKGGRPSKSSLPGEELMRHHVGNRLDVPAVATVVKSRCFASRFLLLLQKQPLVRLGVSGKETAQT